MLICLSVTGSVDMNPLATCGLAAPTATGEVYPMMGYPAPDGPLGSKNPVVITASPQLPVVILIIPPRTATTIPTWEP